MRHYNRAMEKQIRADELISRLPDVLDGIDRERTVYIVQMSGENWRGDAKFVLGPAELCGQVLGLVDEEYGWPKRVELSEIKEVSDLAPSYRRHPFIYKGDRCVAAGIQVGEYEMIKKS